MARELRVLIEASGVRWMAHELGVPFGTQGILGCPVNSLVAFWLLTSERLGFGVIPRVIELTCIWRCVPEPALGF